MRKQSLSSPTGGTRGVGNTTPCCSKIGLKRGPWTAEEDEVLARYIKKEGEGRWRTLPKRAGLLRCGKSCRLRWMNYLRPCVKRGHIAPDEEDLILRLHTLLGNKWSLIAGRIPGRTDNEIKNYWNTHLSKKLISQGIDPRTHKPLFKNPNSPPTTHTFQGPSSSKVSNYPLIGNHTADEFASRIIQTENVFFDHGISMDLQKNAIIIGSHRGGGEEGDVEEDTDTSRCGLDDGFSSFLNSLINEEQEVGKQQTEEHRALNMSSSAAQAFGLDPNWETDVLGSSGLPIRNLHGNIVGEDEWLMRFYVSFFRPTSEVKEKTNQRLFSFQNIISNGFFKNPKHL